MTQFFLIINFFRVVRSAFGHISPRLCELKAFSKDFALIDDRQINAFHPFVLVYDVSDVAR